MATFTYFALNGFVLGMWVVHIPTIERRTHTTPSTLGWLLLLLGVGAFVGMQAVGALTDRHGPRRTVPTAAVLCSAALCGPAFASSARSLAVALLALGLGNGCLDVAMNTHAVHVERGYRRPIMSTFHACYSVGGFTAALVGSRSLARHWPPAATLSVAAVLAALVALGVAPLLLAGGTSAVAPAQTISDGRGAEVSGSRRRLSADVRRRVIVLAGTAFALMLTEGVANDWSTLAARDGLGVSASVAALTYGAFAGAMTAGRCAADRVSEAVGAAAILRWGAALAVAGLAVVASSAHIGLTVLGWAFVGVGLSGCVPNVLSAAGHLDPAAAGANVSRVAGVGYLGMLAGPAAIGPLTHLMALRHTFVLPLLLCSAVISAATGVAGRLSPAGRESGRLVDGKR